MYYSQKSVNFAVCGVLLQPAGQALLYLHMFRFFLLSASISCYKPVATTQQRSLNQSFILNKCAVLNETHLQPSMTKTTSLIVTLDSAMFVDRIICNQHTTTTAQ